MALSDVQIAPQSAVALNYVTFAARFPDVTLYRIWAQNVMARHICSFNTNTYNGIHYRFGSCESTACLLNYTISQDRETSF